MEAPRKFLVRTFGCQMNEHDSERIAAVLAGRGMSRTDSLDDADVVVLNTCCIRQNADDKLYGHLGHLKSVRDKRPGLQIAVGGCLAQKDGESLLERAPYVDAVFGTHNVGRVGALLDQARSQNAPALEVLDAPGVGDEVDFPTAMAVRDDQHYAAWVTIQIGCDNSCAFCIVPAVRGPEVSRPFGDLVREVEVLARSGTTEVTLLGQNVNSYGRDLTTANRASDLGSGRLRHLAGERWVAEGATRPRPLFADLLRSVGSVPGIRRIRFTSPHPKDLRTETIAAMAETPAVCEQLHLPLQSGSDRVLKAMRRGYTAERYLARLAKAREEIEDLAVTTDIIVGFPGETERDFTQTLEVAAEAEYDSAFTFIFSPRPGTRAASMAEDFVAPQDVADRFDRLKVVIERSALARNAARVGQIEEVVVEGPSRKDPKVSSARTRQGKLVHFDPQVPDVVPGEGVGLRPGTYASVRITYGAPHHLVGELVAVEAAPGEAGSARAPDRRSGRAPIPVRSG